MADLKKAAVAYLLGLWVLVITGSAVAAGQVKMIDTGADNVAIKGYDPVAYFTEGRATKGSPDIAFSWNEAEWHFASDAHRDMFVADPEQYAPQFGGRCSMGMALGALATPDPEVWKIIDDRLYLYFSTGAREKFVRSTAENLKKAEANWDKVLE